MVQASCFPFSYKIARDLAVLLCIPVFLFWADPSQAQSNISKGSPEIGGKIVSAYGCTQCHSTDGTILKPGVPNLTGQKAAFLERTMMHMRLGTINDEKGKILIYRYHPVMTEILNKISPWQIRQIALYFEQLPCLDQSPVEAEDTPPRGVSHCVTCHGGKDASNPWQDTPYLAGQDYDYLQKQIHQLWETRRHEHAGPKRYHRLSTIMAFDSHLPYLDAYARYYAGLSCTLRTQ